MCKRCDIAKNHFAFGQKYLDLLTAEVQKRARAHSPFNPTVQGFVACSKCLGLPQMEFKCHMCDVVKARTKFAKTQLKNPDTAVSRSLDHSHLKQSLTGPLGVHALRGRKEELRAGWAGG